MILGACSLCGGIVELLDKWYSTVPPVPTCRSCHATKKLAVIEMEAPRRSFDDTCRVIHALKLLQQDALEASEQLHTPGKP